MSDAREEMERTYSRRRFLKLGGMIVGGAAIGGAGYLVTPQLLENPLNRAEEGLEKTIKEGGLFLASIPGCGPCEALKEDLSEIELPYKKRIYTLSPKDVARLLQRADKRWGGFPYDFVPTVVVNPYHGRVLIAQGYDMQRGELVAGKERVPLSSLRTGRRRGQ